MTKDKPGLEAAYALETPDDNRALYARWAESYDETFAREMDFLMPGHVVRIYLEKRGGAPVLDAGAGTGLVGAAFRDAGLLDIDAIDLSPEMLEVAGRKGLYAKRLVADLTQPLPVADSVYSGVVSSGTFTHGHVGPEALDELMRVAAPEALFALTIKTEHFEDRGFAAKFDSFGSAVGDFEMTSLPVYGPGATGPHRNDHGLVVSFRKT